MNGEKTIKRCIKSVINQSYPSQKVEHIIIDGDSKDRTLSIIRKYKNKIAFWQSKKDRGLYDAMNIGLNRCTGNIIGILNCDDYFRKDALKIVSEYFLNFKIDYLFGSVKKDRIYHNFFPKKLWYSFNIYPSHSVSFFIKKKAHKRIGKYNLKFKYSADRDLIYRLINKSDLKGLATKKNEVLGTFNMHGLSSKVSIFMKFYEEIKIRLSNNENIFQVFIIFITFLIYYSFKTIIKKISK